MAKLDFAEAANFSQIRHPHRFIVHGQKTEAKFICGSDNDFANY